MTDKKQLKATFTKEEDIKLKKLVKLYNKKSSIDWFIIAQQMETRNARQCKDRWLNFLDRKINRKPFTAEENLLILQKVTQIGKKWKLIASMMNKRTDVSVKSQYKKLLRRNATVQNVIDLEIEDFNTVKYHKKRKDQIEEKKPDVSTDHSDNFSFMMNFNQISPDDYPMDQFEVPSYEFDMYNVF